ncbi:MAG: HEAT repeat domain-containing protein [Planctomycetota bacterium]
MALSQASSDRLAVARLPRLTPIPASIDLLPLLLRDDEQDVVQECQRTLHALADHMARLRYQQRDALQQAAIEILQTYPEHHSNEAITAIERLGPCLGPEWRRFLDSADDAEHMLLRSAIRRADDPEAPSRAIAWLAISEVTGAACDALESLRRPGDIAGAMSASHLLRVPARQENPRQHHRAFPRFSFDSLADLDEAAALSHLAWHTSTRSSTPPPPRVLNETLTHTSQALRWAAASATAPLRRQDQTSGSLIEDLAFDTHHAIARSATVALLTSRATEHPGMERLARSAHPGVRRLARLSTMPPRPWQSDASWRRQLHDEPDLVIARLRGALELGEEPTLLSTMRTIDRLALAPVFEKRILALLEHGSARVCASAVMLASRIPSAGARAAIAYTSTHSDPRVRANTIESIARHTPEAPIVVRASVDDIPRLRANAIRARVRVDRHEGVSMLEDMLVDDRPGHRLSALWVAQRSSIVALTDRVSSMVASEPDPRVRTRASACSGALKARAMVS